MLKRGNSEGRTYSGCSFNCKRVQAGTKRSQSSLQPEQGEMSAPMLGAPLAASTSNTARGPKPGHAAPHWEPRSSFISQAVKIVLHRHAGYSIYPALNSPRYFPDHSGLCPGDPTNQRSEECTSQLYSALPR